MKRSITAAITALALASCGGSGADRRGQEAQVETSSLRASAQSVQAVKPPAAEPKIKMVWPVDPVHLANAEVESAPLDSDGEAADSHHD
jgi:hypothetical protein